MSLRNHLNHRCTVQRATVEADSYGHDVPEYDDLIIQLPCRLVYKEQKIVSAEAAERVVITMYKMLILPRAPIQLQQGDRIIDVVNSHGLVDAGPFRVQSIMKRNGHIERHQTLRLERTT